MSCPVCGGMLCYLGRMGRLNWFRCQDCGMDSCRERDPDESQDVEEDED